MADQPTRPSKARVLIAVESRYGGELTAVLSRIEPQLFIAYLLEGGDAGDDDAFEAFIDATDDPLAAVQEVAEVLDTPTTPSE